MGRPPVERIALECAVCGKEVMRRVTDAARLKTGRVFCSRECRGVGGTKPITIPERDCEQCGTTFRPRQSKNVGRFCSKVCYDEAQRKLPLRHCEVCDALFSRSPSQIELRGSGRFCSRACYEVGRYKRAIGRQHNGKPARMHDEGYVLVWQPDHPNALSNGWIFEHRLVAAEMIGRPLTTDDQVHHVNRIRHDNRPDNLEVLDSATHSVITSNGRQSDRELLAEYIRRYGPLDMQKE